MCLCFDGPTSESIVPPHLRRGVFRPSNKLIALLRRAS
jgi:hypothetical protein